MVKFAGSASKAVFYLEDYHDLLVRHSSFTGIGLYAEVSYSSRFPYDKFWNHVLVIE